MKYGNSMKTIDEKKNSILVWPVTIIILGVLMIMSWLCMPVIVKLLGFANHINRSDFNAVDIYIGMLSIAFIVTSIVTVLSDKSNVIYWTTVVEYQLVNPRFISLREIVTYLAVIAAYGFLSLFVFPEFIFACLLLTVISLFLITYRMIDGFINRKRILRELKTQFVFCSFKNHCFSILEKSADLRESTEGIEIFLSQKKSDSKSNENNKDIKSFEKWVQHLMSLTKSLKNDDTKMSPLQKKVHRLIKRDKDFHLYYDYWMGNINDKPVYRDNPFVVLKNSLIGNLMAHIEDDDLYRVAEDVELLYLSDEDWKTPVKIIIKKKPYLYYQLSKALSFISFFDNIHEEANEERDKYVEEFSNLFLESCKKNNEEHMIELVYSDCNNAKNIVDEGKKLKYQELMDIIEKGSFLSDDKKEQIETYGDDRLKDGPPKSWHNNDIKDEE